MDDIVYHEAVNDLSNYLLADLDLTNWIDIIFKKI